MEKEKRNNFHSRKKWTSFIFLSIILIILTFWTQSLWWLILIPFFFDIYLSRKLPWGFWRKWKNKTLRTIMDWIDAIIFALAAVYVINIYIFQNYQIPSSSLEKSLLVGDFLFVSKISYGPRVPNTPLYFPLAQNEFPIIHTKSYFDKPQWPYKRVKGFGKIKRNDIVVFNFPAGDTLTTKISNPDYYSLREVVAKQNKISTGEADRYIKKHPGYFGKIITRPVDRRDNYVKRCLGLPGETLQIKNRKVFINGKEIKDRPGVQYNYFFQTNGKHISDKMFSDLNISKADRHALPPSSPLFSILGFENNGNPVYTFPATNEIANKLKNSNYITKTIIEPDTINGYNLGEETYPLSNKFNWTRDNYGPIHIPAKGETIELTEKNVILYQRVIRNYERHTLQKSGNKYLIDGKETTTYTFGMDYYWMMGDNRHNSADSRYWGFVPEDHIVGKPIFIWLSLDKDKGWFSGKIRWKRLFKSANR